MTTQDTSASRGTGIPRTMSVPSLMGTAGTTPERRSLLEHEHERERDIEHGYGASTTGSTKSRPPTPGTPNRRKSTLVKKARYYVPSMEWIPNYSFTLLGGDLIAGLTVACMLIPQSVSYASSLAKLSPVTGLFSASIPGIVYALLGTSRQLNVAPEAALSLLVGQAVSDALHGHHAPGEGSPSAEAVALAVSTVITIQTGLISFLLGFFRLGFIDVVLSRALLRGFVTAVAVVILIEQLIPMFGLLALEHTLNPHSTSEKALFLLEYAPTDAHPLTTAISLLALGALMGARTIKGRTKRKGGSTDGRGGGEEREGVEGGRGEGGAGWVARIPEVLIVVVVSILLSERLRWDEAGVSILGEVPIRIGSSYVQFPLRHANLRYLKKTTFTAFVVSLMGFLDSIVAAKQNGARFKHTVSPNRELVALGAANLVGSFVPGTLPAYGSITRSRINGDAGGRTQMSSLVCSTLILLATFFLLPWMYFLPKCVLGAVICLVVFSLIAEVPHDVVYYFRMRAWTDLGLMTLTFVLSVLWDLEMGISVGIVLSLLLVLRRSARPRMTILGHIPGTDTWKPINENPEAEEDVPGVLIVRIRENLDFANTSQLKERLRRLELYGVEGSHPSEEPSRQQASVLVFHMADVDACDASAVQIFHELLEMYLDRNVTLYIAHLRASPRAMFARAGIIEMLGEDAFCVSVAEAVNKLRGGGRI